MTCGQVKAKVARIRRARARLAWLALAPALIGEVAEGDIT